MWLDNEFIEILIVNNDRKIKIKRDTSLLEILEISKFKKEIPIVAGKINNRLTNLRHKLRQNSKVEFISLVHPEGFRVYQNSISFLLRMAVSEIFPNYRLKIEHSISKGLYCEIIDKKLNEEDIKKIKKKMNEYVEYDLPIEKIKTYLDEVRDFFKRTNQEDKIRLFKYSNPHTIDIYYCGNYKNYSDCPLVPSTGVLKSFDIHHFENGFIVVTPEPYSDASVPEFIPQKNLFSVFHEYESWLRALQLEDIGALNELIVNGKEDEVIWTSESLHEKKFSQIADGIKERDASIVLIAGPSSSGKTTSSKRLSIHLRVNNISSFPISLDDYFLDREKTPRDENGDYDFESLYALDLDLLREHFEKIIKMKPIKLPKYNFHTGKREWREGTFKREKNQVVIFEGIHAINPELIRDIPSGKIVKIYISPLTTLSMDDHNRIPTTDVRLLRRIVRDYLFRGYSALDTLKRWDSVRKGEQKYIFPYQNDADFFFNSALVYELAVLKRYAEPLLYRISSEYPEYSEARRLLKFLSYFQDINPDQVPSTSILREFIGKSGFRY